MKKLTVCLSFLLLVLVAGCSLVPTPTEMPTSLPSATQAPTATATLAAPTATLAQKTPTQTPTIFFKRTPAAMPTIVPTIMAMAKPQISLSSLSPDGEWRADLIAYDCMQIGDGEEVAYEQLNIVHLTDMSAVGVDFQVQSCEGTGARGIGPLFWSSNSRFFYYTTARMGRPDGCSYWQPPIYRIDVNFQTKQFIGAGELSPDNTKIAAWENDHLWVWDVNGQKLTGYLFQDPEIEEGPIDWCADSQQVVFLQFESSCPLSGKSSVGYINLSENEYSVIEYEDHTFGDVYWYGFDKFVLVDADGKEYIFDLDDWQLKPFEY